jgi:hypothetical protein
MVGKITKNFVKRFRQVSLADKSYALLVEQKNNATHRGVSLGSLADEAIVAAYGKPPAEALGTPAVLEEEER